MTEYIVRNMKAFLLSALIVLSGASDFLSAETIPVFVFAGQSNAIARRGNYSQLTGALATWKTPQADVLFAGPQGQGEDGAPVWAPIAPVPNLTEFSFGPELSAGKVIADGLNQTIGVVKYAVGATWLADKPNANDTWNPAKTGGLYSQMLNRVNTSLAQLPVQQSGTTGEVAGFFWLQGESDAIELTDANAYKANLTAFIAQVRNDFGNPSLPFILGQTDHPGFPANSDIVRAAQQAVANEIANVYAVDTTFLSRHGDLIHLNTQGILDVGTAFGGLYLATVPEPNSCSLLLFGMIGLRLLHKRK